VELKAKIPAEQGIAALAYLTDKNGMRLLAKTADETWHGAGRKHSNLDHVVAAKDLRFKRFGDAEVDVRGWPRLPEAEHQAWMKSHSDHGLLYFEVQRVQ
jgi:hypothetical protein